MDSECGSQIQFFMPSDAQKMAALLMFQLLDLFRSFQKLVSLVKGTVCYNSKVFIQDAVHLLKEQYFTINT